MLFSHRIFLERILTIGFLIAAAACGRAIAPATQPPTFEQDLLREQEGKLTREELMVPKTAAAYYQFIRGELALADGRFKESLAFFEAAAAAETKPAPALRKRLAQLYFKAGDGMKALEQLNYAIAGSPDDLDLLALRAAILASEKNVPEAISAYRELIAKTPANQDYYILLSSLYSQSGDNERAVEILKQLIKQVPDSLFGYYYLGRLYESIGNVKEAEKFYNSAVKLNPESDSLQTDFARTIALQGREKEAIEVCERIVKNNPKNFGARMLLAQLYWEAKRYQDAIDQFTAIQAAEDDSSDTRLKIALIRLEMKDYSKAATDLEELLKIAPANAQAHYFLASAYAGLNRIDDALRELNAIGEEDKMFLESKTLAAYILRQAKRYPEALKQLELALSARPKEPNLLGYRAAIEHEADMIDAAIETTQQLIEIEPKSAQHYFSLGVLYDRKENRGEALVQMRKAIEVDPNYASALNYVGYSLAEDGGSLRDAEDYVRRALKSEPNNGFYLDSLGWVYFKMGRYKDALVQLERAVAVVPTDAVILEHYGEILLKLGKKSEATAAFQKALAHAPESDDEKVTERLTARLRELNALAK